jgi:hypothetical protein
VFPFDIYLMRVVDDEEDEVFGTGVGDAYSSSCHVAHLGPPLHGDRLVQRGAFRVAAYQPHIFPRQSRWLHVTQARRIAGHTLSNGEIAGPAKNHRVRGAESGRC